MLYIGVNIIWYKILYNVLLNNNNNCYCYFNLHIFNLLEKNICRKGVFKMKIKKFLISGLLAIFFILNFGGNIVAEIQHKEISAYIDNTMSIEVNGKDFDNVDEDGTQYKPIVYNNRIYLPVRALSDVFGAQTSWDDKTNTVKIQQISDTVSSVNVESREIKNVIFMIGDGMGLNQVQLTQWYHVGAYDKMNMQKMPVIGLVSTYSASSGVTDSAAAGTALATGFKTNNSTVGLDPSGKKLKNLLEAAREVGKSTGLVVTSEITDATPAAFSAHQKSRKDYELIAEDISKCNAEVILGGGYQYFLPKSKGGARTDNKNLLKEMENNQYTVVKNISQMNSVKSGKLVGLFKSGTLSTPYPEDKTGVEPTLAQMTSKAIELLSSNTNGFVLMVEGSKIDKVAHSNAAGAMRNETILFDNAVKVALDFAAKDGNTLVIVTADHETGGLAMPDNALPTKGKKSTAKWTTTNHSASHVPIYAYGPGAIEFTGMLDNTDIPKKVAKMLNLKDFPKVME